MKKKSALSDRTCSLAVSTIVCTVSSHPTVSSQISILKSLRLSGFFLNLLFIAPSKRLCVQLRETKRQAKRVI
jgi:hypothetical protein